MKKVWLLLVVIFACSAALLVGWSPKWEDPQLPRAGIHGDGVGLQVCVVEVDALGKETFLGTNEVTHFPASSATRDQFAVNVSRMADIIIGPRSPYNLQVAMMRFTNKREPVSEGSMVCSCAAAIYDGGGKFYGCNLAGCAGCAYCRVRAIR